MEAHLDAAADDDKARDRWRREIYTPPKTATREQVRQRRTGMDLAAARALAAQIALEDGQLMQRRR